MSIQFEQFDRLAILKINRPDVMNALNRQTVQDLRNHILEIQNQKDISVVIVTGVGKAFCAGADLKERRGMPDDQVVACVDSLRNTFHSLYHLPQVTIAAINGVALGGGLELALACDLRYTFGENKMGLPETKLAIIPGAGGTQRLSRVVGPAKAKELIFTGRTFSGQDAENWSLVNQLFDKDSLLDACMEIGESIAQNGPVALIQAKKAIQLGFESDLEEGLAIERQAYGAVVPTKDRIEALHAFREKRSPIFTGE